MENTRYKNLYQPNLSNPLNTVKEIENLISKSQNLNVEIDLAEMNIFDATRVLVFASSYLYRKAPNDKLKFRAVSSEIKNIISSFSLNNLEMV